MRNIWGEKEIKVAKPKGKRSEGKFAWELDAYLLEKCQNLLNSQKFPRQYTSLGDLVKQALEAYINKKFTLIIPSQKDNPKRQISVRFSADLVEYYQTIPLRQRKEFIELVLINYLDSIKKGKKL